jgi:hypothetical protein
MSARRGRITAALCLLAAVGGLLQGLPLTNVAAAASLKLEHVLIFHPGIAQNYVVAIGEVTARARAAAVEEFGFDMPPIITVYIAIVPSEPPKLWTDGASRIYMRIRSTQDLRQPAESSIFQIYGLCHEIGHMAMYRLIRNARRTTAEAAEGWAHYLGSRLVDAVHARSGPELWPDRYDYLEDGTQRLQTQLAATERTADVNAAATWKELTELVGDRGVAPIFRTWGALWPDPAHPVLTADDVLRRVKESLPSPGQQGRDSATSPRRRLQPKRTSDK